MNTKEIARAGKFRVGMLVTPKIGVVCYDGRRILCAGEPAKIVAIMPKVRITYRPPVKDRSPFMLVVDDAAGNRASLNLCNAEPWNEAKKGAG